MKTHTFRSSSHCGPRPLPPVPVMEGVRMDVFQHVNGGGFIDEVPAGYAPCLPGFRPYRMGSGEIIGVQADAGET